LIDKLKIHTHIDFVSLSYQPAYLDNSLIHTKLRKLKKENDLYWGFDDVSVSFTLWGSQAYLLSRKVAEKVVTLLYHDKLSSVEKHLVEYVKTHKTYAHKEATITIDALLPLILNQGFVYPMLCIEKYFTSSISNNSLRAKQMTMYCNLVNKSYYDQPGTAELDGEKTIIPEYMFAETHLDTLAHTKKVGIVIHDKASLYSNGITQNAYFIYQLLQNIGMNPEFLCHETNPSKFEKDDLVVRYLSENPLEFNYNDYHTILTVTRGLSQLQYDQFKKAKCFIVAFTCGNNLMHNMEDFVRGPYTKGVSTFISRTTPCDELWLIPSYSHSLDYVSVIRGKPSYIIPHLWSPEIILETAVSRFNKKESDLVYQYAKHTKPKLDILILEPNMALFKNAWLAVVACEKLHQMHPDLIENVYIFNMPEHNLSYSMVESLTVGPRIRKFKRLSIPEIMTHFNDKDTFPIVLSHQVLNSLNYLYYELLYYGWPLVHNSRDTEGNGYYYPDNDITACANAILLAYNTHAKHIDDYMKRGRIYTEKINPMNKEMGKVWKQMIYAGVVKSQAS
jgi:hypothetical protein